MKKSKRILFTCVGRRMELLQMFRAASDNTGIPLELYGTDLVSEAPALTVCDHIFLVPGISDPAYIPALLEICRSEQIEAVVPTIDTDLLPLSTRREDFEKIGTRIVISSVEKIALSRDKRLTAEYFTSVGLRCPRTYHSVKDYDGGFPAFIKPRDGSASVEAYRIEDEEELYTVSKRIHDYIIQPFVSGTEYTVDIFCDFEGHPIYITPRIRQEIRAGEVLKTKISQDERIISEVLQLVRDFRPCGAITVQLIRDGQTGQDWFIEINPRFGGGAPLSMMAGADAASAMLRLLAGEKVAYQPNAASDESVYSRFDQCVCIDPGKDAWKNLDAVIFDLDDTLYSEKDYVHSGFHAAASLLTGIENAEDKLWKAFEEGRPAIDAVLQDAGIDDPSLKAQCLERYREHRPEISLYPGVRELLAALRQAGKKLAILTDGRPGGQRRKLQALGLENLVDEILITDELGGIQFRKPNDVGFRILKYRLGVPYERMAYVGDNPQKDFQAPRMLGMPYVYYQNENGLYSRNSYGPLTVHDFAELREILL